MKLEKAIELVDDHRKLILVDKNPDLKAATQLLIEAGKRIQHYRSVNPTYRERPLPGETED